MINANWIIASFKDSVLWNRSAEETWVLNPPNRYLLNACHLPKLQEHIDTVSELKNGALYRPFHGDNLLHGAKVLVERFRDRGVGDLLFMTGVFDYFHHLTGGKIKFYVYSLSDRGAALDHHPALATSTTLSGPVEYDSLRNYDYHWLVDSVTECDQENDQLNVYDALFKQCGLNPATIDPKWKKPSVKLVQDDLEALHSLSNEIYHAFKVDLRKTPYIVVAPLAYSSLRVAPYTVWLKTIKELAKTRPVVVVGEVREGGLINSDISFGKFYQEIAMAGNNVINLLGKTQLRTFMALMSQAKLFMGLDSGPLYIAQALRIPAVSLWGSHDPGVRIGYDSAYMANAIWNRPACTQSPCYAYSGFPVEKCPQGSRQRMCEVLSSVTVEMLLNAVEKVE